MGECWQYATLYYLYYLEPGHGSLTAGETAEREIVMQPNWELGNHMHCRYHPWVLALKPSQTCRVTNTIKARAVIRMHV